MSIEGSSESAKIINSPLQINLMANLFNTLMLFLLPSIIGLSIYRDFSHNMHTLLYSFPFSKRDYLFGKLLSSVLIVMAIIGMIGLGFMLAPFMPMVNPANVVPLHFAPYLQLYLVYLLPNILLFGAIVFAIVAFSRNIYAGFIAVILIIILQLIIEGLLKGVEWRYLAALLDPLGDEAVKYYTRFWTLAERNEQMPPLKGVIIYNRLLWLSISIAIFGGVFKYFTFSQEAFAWKTRKGTEMPVLKTNVGNIIKVNLPKVYFDFSFLQQLKITWHLSRIDFKQIISSWPFITILLAGFLAIFLQQSEMNPAYGIKLLPVTWKMLQVPTFIFSGLINLVTFLYAGILIHRSRIARIDALVDISPLPNWAFLLSKVIALVNIQISLLAFIIIAGIIVQIYNGYYQFEVGLYLFEVYGLHLIHFLIWACLAVFIQSLFTNPYLGFFILLLVPIGTITLPGFPEKVGLDFLSQEVFWYNKVPGYLLGFEYSDLNGYGTYLPIYFVYKTYWALGAMILLVLAYLCWTRGMTYSFKERMTLAKSRFKGPVRFAFLLFFVCFSGMGFSIYFEENVWHKSRVTTKDQELFKVENEKRYKRYEHIIQPRITAVNIKMDLFPKAHRFLATGEYTFVNQSAKPIDTLLVAYSFKEHTRYAFNKPLSVISEDSLRRLDVLKLQTGLLPGDSLKMTFELRNQDNTLLGTHSRALANGTFIGSQVFPKLGYRSVELTDNKKRAQYGLPQRTESTRSPSDSMALGYANPFNDTDWIDFEATVSTSDDQVAIAPGILQKEWQADGRRYFHYKTDHKITHAFTFNSGRYEVRKDQWEGVEVAIYYHKGHEHNLERLSKGVKASLAYNSEYFGPFKHAQIRIVEYPRSEGTYATVMGNVMPYAETYFICDVDENNENDLNLPFYVSAHEIAHHWWGHQVNPANVLGSKMVTESLAQYVALKVLERKYGKKMMRKFLRNDLDIYLSGRANESKKETPLRYSSLNQEYVNYQKGALAFYALSDYIGEENLNTALNAYAEKVRFQGPPFPNALALLDTIKRVVPDSLQYLVKDLFETITLYDNKVTGVTTTPLDNGKYQVDIDFSISKFRSDGYGHRFNSDDLKDSLSYTPEGEKATVFSLPLADYIEVGIFSEQEIDGKKQMVELYLQQQKITTIGHKMSIIVDQAPTEVGIDPYYKLIDIAPADNRKVLEHVSRSL